MNLLNSNPPTTARPWPNKKPSHRSPFLFLTFLFFFLLYYSFTPISPLLDSFRAPFPSPPECASRVPFPREKFLWYAPHSGFSNQLSEFKNAILMAGILYRTLIVLQILDHHAVALGSCPKFRVLDLNKIRISVWEHVVNNEIRRERAQ